MIEVSGRAQMLTLDGDFGASTTGATAQSDIESLGLDDDEYTFSPRADFEFGPWHVSADGFASSLSGEGSVDGSLSIGGIDLSVGDAIASSIDLRYGRVIGTIDLIPSDLIDLGIGLGIIVADVNAEIEDTGSGLREEVGELIVGPVAAARGRVKVGRASVGVAASGIAFDVDDVDVMHLDLDASANLRIFGIGGLEALLEGGYRYLLIDVAFSDGDDNVDTELRYAGPYIGIRLSF